MSASYDLEVAVPGTGAGDGDGPSFRRIFVPVRSPGESAASCPVLNVPPKWK